VPSRSCRLHQQAGSLGSGSFRGYAKFFFHPRGRASFGAASDEVVGMYNREMSERTLAIVKPDAVSRRLAGRIMARIEEGGFQIRAIRRVHLSKREAEGFYAVHRSRPF